MEPKRPTFGKTTLPTRIVEGNRVEEVKSRLPPGVLPLLRRFYAANPHIQESHGLPHVQAVHRHAVNAIAHVSPTLSHQTAMEVEVAALLHDVDDHKYATVPMAEGEVAMPNAREICRQAGISADSVERIAKMISWVSCSANGNSVPTEVEAARAYHLLIPRWSDRLEAVGAVGVVRCYQYNCEKGAPLSTDASPKATTEEEVLELATPERFEAYMRSGGSSADMISHYYEKLLHVARPPSEIVRNAYLEQKATLASRALLEVCVRFGRTGKVDEEYIKGLERALNDGEKRA